MSYKQVKLIVQAFNQLQLPLVVIGDGPDLPLLQELAQPNVQILGPQPNAVVEDYMARAKAFVYGACEDFGIALVEAQACGTPVIAFGRGGALETVVDYQKNPKTATGIWFDQQTVESLVQAVETFSNISHQISSENCFLQANRFSSKIFQTSYLALLEKYCHQAPRRT